MPKKKIAPMVHMNGTSKDGLIEPLASVYSTLNEALDKMRHVAPNGRDYYLLGRDACEQARVEHLERCGRIIRLRDEIELLIAAIEAGETEFEVPD